MLFGCTAYRHWQSVPPVSLFTAPLTKSVKEDSHPIKRTLERESRKAQWLILWTDCDREGIYGVPGCSFLDKVCSLKRICIIAMFA